MIMNFNSTENLIFTNLTGKEIKDTINEFGAEKGIEIEIEGIKDNTIYQKLIMKVNDGVLDIEVIE